MSVVLAQPTTWEPPGVGGFQLLSSLFAQLSKKNMSCAPSYTAVSKCAYPMYDCVYIQYITYNIAHNSYITSYVQILIITSLCNISTHARLHIYIYIYIQIYTHIYIYS